MDATTAAAVAVLARRIRTLEAAQKTQGRASQAAYRSVEGVSPVRMYDDDGELRSRWGVQPDGSVTRVDLGGDAPDTPSAPIIEEVPGALVITWDGWNDEDEAGWSANFAGVRVHLSTEAGFTVEDHDPVALIAEATGGTVTYALPGSTVYYVKLVAVTTAGVTSSPSAEASGTPQVNGDANYYSPTEPLGLGPDDDGASWYDTDDDNRHYRWDGSLLEWVPVDIGVGTLRVGGNLTVDMQLTGGEVIAGDPAGAHVAMGDYGIEAYAGADPVDDLRFRVDADTGDVTVLGELGTALPGDIGIFMFTTGGSNTGNSRVRPTMQFNVGSLIQQPEIYGDSVAGSGLFLRAGRAGAGEREARGKLDNGLIRWWVEDTAGAGDVGARLDIANDYLLMRSRYTWGSDNLAATLDLDSADGFVGYIAATAGDNRQGLWINRGDDLRLFTAGNVKVRQYGNTGYAAIAASSFDVTSDRASKTDITDVRESPLAIVRASPAYEWRYLDDPETTRRVGPMADDLPEWVTGWLEGGEDGATPMRSLSLTTQVGLLWGAVQELTDVLLSLNIGGLRARLP